MISAGILSGFRADAAKALDHRWTEASALVQQTLVGRLPGSVTEQPAPRHEDQRIAAVARLGILTFGFRRAPSTDVVRPTDIPVLQSVDLAFDDQTSRLRHTLRCLLIGQADDQLVEQHLGVPAEVSAAYHDLFFNIRPILDRPLVVSDLVFGPCFMQGGTRTPQDTELIVAYLCSADMFLSYRLGIDHGDQSMAPEVFDSVVRALSRNQTLSSMLRRSLGFESTERTVEQLHQQVLLDRRAALGASADTRGEAMRETVLGLGQKIGVSVAGPDSYSTARVEAPGGSHQAIAKQVGATDAVQVHE